MEKGLTHEEQLILQEKLNKARAELTILYEISNAMRTTLKLDEILYIILTGVTAHEGLAFNRAILLLFNERENILEGKIGIGPDTGEEADRIWRQIETEKMGLDDLISAYKKSAKMLESKFNRMVTHLKVPSKEKEGGILALAFFDGMPLHITKETISNYANDPLLNLLKVDELAVAPLKAKDKVNGIIVADNAFTHRTITKDDMRMLIMLSNQAGLAIDNSRLYEHMVTRSHTDSLTHLWNHGYFQYILQEELERSKANNLGLSLIMVDIDNFKNYNDSLGHQFGDEILRNLARLLKDYSRKMDFVCRYGGEEFTIILPQTNKKEAYSIAGRLREAIEKYHFPHEEIQPSQKLTVSLGLATFPEDGLTNSELIASCDRALYEAKKAGKNKVFCF